MRDLAHLAHRCGWKPANGYRLRGHANCGFAKLDALRFGWQEAGETETLQNPWSARTGWATPQPALASLRAAMPPAVNLAVHIRFKSNSRDEDAQIKSMSDSPGGALLANRSFWLAQMNDITSPDAADNVTILQDQLDYVALDSFALDDDLDRGPPTFSILPHRWVQLGKNLLDAGMPTTPTGSWEATRAVVREYMAHLSEEERLLSSSDAYIPDHSGDETWVSLATPKRVRASTQGNANLPGTVRDL